MDFYSNTDPLTFYLWNIKKVICFSKYLILIYKLGLVV